MTSAVLVSFTRIEWCRLDFHLLFVSLCADWEAVVKLSEDFNGADLRNVCTEAGQLQSDLFLWWMGGGFDVIWKIVAQFLWCVCAQPVWLCRCMIYVHLKLWVQCIDFPFPGLICLRAVQGFIVCTFVNHTLWFGVHNTSPALCVFQVCLLYVLSVTTW